jgi:hypothetical protein
MVRSHRITVALGAICLSLSLYASTAQAEGPASVTVRVEGVEKTLVPPKVVTTTTTPVVNDGNPEDYCSGTSALGALQVATGGDWSGSWFSGTEPPPGQYFVNVIDGESHLYESGKLSYYWSFWLNDRESEAGACDVQLESGDRVLFIPVCDEECPATPAPTPLEIEAPADVIVGESVNVIVKQYNQAGEASPAAGALISWPGGTATTDSAGDATLTFSAEGTPELKVSAPNAIRTEVSVCVAVAGASTCGGKAALGAGGSSGSGGSPGSSGSSATSSKTAPRAFIASLLGLAEEHVYRAGHAPRVLQGYASTGGAPRELKLRLTRRAGARGRGSCSYYDGSTDTFTSMHCGAEHGRYFSIPPAANFSYLLPGALSPGRYVLDLEATGANGVHTKLERGSTRFVFYVR